MEEAFSDNAEGVLAEALDDGSVGGKIVTTIKLTSAHHNFAWLADISSPQFQRATISDAAQPGVFEIVEILAWDTEATGTVATIKREYSGRRAWPEGAKISGRVTSGMLRALQYLRSDDRVIRPRPQNGGYHFSGVFGLSTSFGVSNATPVDSIHVERTMEKLPRGTEMVYRSMAVDAGAPPTHDSDAYHNTYAIVVPPTPDGYQYQLVMTAASASTDGPVTFPGNGQPAPLFDADDPSKEKGYWVPTKVPIRFESYVGSFVPTEVGFITYSDTAATKPVVSIGTEGNEGEFLNAVTVGATPVTRHLVSSAPASLSQTFVFKVDTPAVGGSHVGMFYLKGFHV